MYVWLRAPEICIQRVRARVRRGGHHVSEDVVRRRYARSAVNFLHLYKPLAKTWRVYDNSGTEPVAVATGGLNQQEKIYEADTWNKLEDCAGEASQDA